MLFFLVVSVDLNLVLYITYPRQTGEGDIILTMLLAVDAHLPISAIYREMNDLLPSPIKEDCAVVQPVS